MGLVLWEGVISNDGGLRRRGRGLHRHLEDGFDGSKDYEGVVRGVRWSLLCGFVFPDL